MCGVLLLFGFDCVDGLLLVVSLLACLDIVFLFERCRVISKVFSIKCEVIAIPDVQVHLSAIIDLIAMVWAYFCVYF